MHKHKGERPLRPIRFICPLCDCGARLCTASSNHPAILPPMERAFSWAASDCHRKIRNIDKALTPRGIPFREKTIYISLGIKRPADDVVYPIIAAFSPSSILQKNPAKPSGLIRYPRSVHLYSVCLKSKRNTIIRRHANPCKALADNN